MNTRHVHFFAHVLLLTAGCGDPQLNESRREFYLVSLDGWHARYVPGITAIVPFPQLAEVSAPRFTSSDPSVAEVSVFRQDIDQPRFRALRITTSANGDTDISLYDGDRLVRAETVRVDDADSFRFDFTIQNQVAPPEAALAPDEEVRLLENAPVPAMLRFYSDDDEVVAAGVTSSQLFFTGVLLRSLGDVVDTPISTQDGLYRSQEQVSSGDFFQITAVTWRGPYIDLPSGASIGPSFEVEQTRLIDGLEIVASPTRVGNRASIAVFGLNGGTRVVGLDPAVTLDGVPLKHCEYESECSGKRSPTLAEWRWLFPLPDDVQTGTIEARWRGLTASAELGTME